MSNVSLGQRFSRWTVAGDIHKKKGYRYVYCRCSCGKGKDVSLDNLLSGRTQSCGCLANERTSKAKTKHKLMKHPLYGVWQSMLNRCRNKNVNAFKDYGGRGIDVCQGWHEFVDFYKWALSAGYRKGLTLDRIDNEGKYEPRNCRWATHAQQKRNTRASHNITHPETGETLCMMDWGLRLGGSKSLVSNRILSYGWTPERAITTPVIRHI